MARTALLFVVPALLLGSSWYGLETGDRHGIEAAWMALLALLPALAPTWRMRLVAALLVAPVALSSAFDVPISLGFLGDVVGDLKDGVLAFYDVSLPFQAGEEPLMHGAVLTAIFAFCLVVSLGLAARRPLVAAVGLVAGAAWPATLVGSENRIGLGALILAGVLSLLAWGGRRPAQSPRPALLAGAAVVLAAAAAGAQPAVAKGEFLGWKGWDPYDQPADPVGVDYVWDASYDGIQFPSEPTDVLTVTGPQRAQYWRAGILDEFRNGRWVEAPSIIAISDGAQDLSNDPLPAGPRADDLPARSARASRSRRSATTTSSRRGRRSRSTRAGSARSSTATAMSPSSTAGSSAATSTRSGATCRALARASSRTSRSTATLPAQHPRVGLPRDPAEVTRCRRSGPRNAMRGCSRWPRTSASARRCAATCRSTGARSRSRAARGRSTRS